MMTDAVQNTPFTSTLHDGSRRQSPEPTVLSSSKALNGQVALIVGGSRGIGWAVASELYRRGCTVTVASREPNGGAPTSDAEQAIFRSTCDVRRAAEVEATLQRLITDHGQIDIVVNCAGISRVKTDRQWVNPLMNLSEEEWQEVSDTNIRGMFLVTKAAARRMIPRRKGQILNISSARGARRGQPFASAYCATKMAALAMFQALTAELATWGIRAWSLLPDAVATELIARTNLASRGAIDTLQMGSLIADLLSLPSDVIIEDALLAPQGLFTQTIAGTASCRP